MREVLRREMESCSCLSKTLQLFAYIIPLYLPMYLLGTVWLIINTQRAAIEETKAVFPPLRERITDALKKLEEQLEAGQASGASEEEITKAKEVIKSAQDAAKQ